MTEAVRQVLETARGRFTTKHYDPAKHISREQMEALLEVLRLAPSSVNIQPWHHYVVASPEARAKLMPAVKDFNIERVRHADAVILLAIEKNVGEDAWLDKLFAQEVADGRLPSGAKADEIDQLRRTAAKAYCRDQAAAERWASEQVHIALGFVLMAAAQIGVQTTVLGGLWFEQVDEIFGIAREDRHVVVGLAVGVGDPADANAVRPKSRLPMEEIVTLL